MKVTSIVSVHKGDNPDEAIKSASEGIIYLLEGAHNRSFSLVKTEETQDKIDTIANTTSYKLTFRSMKDELKELVSDKEIIAAFKANVFIGLTDRAVIKKSLLNLTTKHEVGEKEISILRDLGLVNKKEKLNKKGEKYLRAAYINK